MARHSMTSMRPVSWRLIPPDHPSPPARWLNCSWPNCPCDGMIPTHCQAERALPRKRPTAQKRLRWGLCLWLMLTPAFCYLGYVLAMVPEPPHVMTSNPADARLCAAYQQWRKLSGDTVAGMDHYCMTGRVK